MIEEGFCISGENSICSIAMRQCLHRRMRGLCNLNSGRIQKRMRKSKLGLHILGTPPDFAYLQDWIRRVRPRFIILLEGALDEPYWPMWAWCLQNGITLMGRKVIEYQDQITAQELSGQIIDLVRRGCPVKLWQGKNENDQTDEGGAKREANFDLAMANLLQPHGIAYAPYMAYQVTMNWNGTTITDHFLDMPEVRALAAHPNVWGFVIHEYWHHCANDFLDWPRDKTMIDVTTGKAKAIWVPGPWGWATWWVNRCEMWHWYFRTQIPGWAKPVVVAEMGIETYSNADTKPPWGGQSHGGWQSYTTAPLYAAQTKRVDLEMYQPSKAIFATSNYTYGDGGNPRWMSYRTDRLVAGEAFLGATGQHIIDCGDEGGGMALPDWIMDLRAETTNHTGLTIAKHIGIMVHHSGKPAPLENLLTYLKGAECAYHFVIGPNDQIFCQRDIGEVCWHAGNDVWNGGGVAVCFAGCYMDTPPTDGPAPTDTAFASFAKLRDWLVSLGVPNNIVGHKDINPTTRCPGDWYPRMKHRLLPAADAELGQLRVENATLRAKLGQAKEARNILDRIEL